MTVTFFDRGDLANPLNGSELDSVLDLELALRRPAEREALVCELAAPDGRTLWVGLGGELGYVQYRAGGGIRTRLMAAPRGSRQSQGSAELMLGDTPTGVPIRYRLTAQLTFQTAAYFLETGGLNPDVTWQAV